MHLCNDVVLSYPGVRVSRAKPSNCFRCLENLVLPSIFDTSLSSFMLWGLQSCPTTVLSERMWHFRESRHALTPPTYFQGVRTPSNPVIYAPAFMPLHRAEKSPLGNKYFVASIYQYKYLYLGFKYYSTSSKYNRTGIKALGERKQPQGRPFSVIQVQ